MSWILAAVMLANNPREAEPLNVGILEVNVVVNEFDQPRFTQLIFRQSRGNIMAWRYKDAIKVPKTPWVDFSFMDEGKFKRFAGWRLETRTDYDPELDERQWLPEHFRSGLQ